MEQHPVGAAAIDVEPGQVIRLHHAGELVASATRHGRGWTVCAARQRHEAVTIDHALVMLGLLPNHRR